MEVLNLKQFLALDVLSKLQGLWVSQHSNILYVLATRVTFICAMSFDAFPLDVQSCLLQVGQNKNRCDERPFDRIKPGFFLLAGPFN